ncbi:MAG: methyltransferase domain-containing protein [Planctomycetes bacterium]|nr:methyltransferase domain-containing protein [Planctomycetota bacterium]
MNQRVLHYCVCPACRSSDLRHESEKLVCPECDKTYPVIDGIPVLLPEYADEKQNRYLKNYEKLARDDLETPIVENRFMLLHQSLIRFIGSVKGKSILDVGSSDASYLRELVAKEKVAVDIALPYLQSIPEESGIMRVCGDAEDLPVDPGRFDVIIISDVLEHLLDPERLVSKLSQYCSSKTRIIIHIPWAESLDSYRDGQYEFAHLRSFQNYNLRLLFRDFRVKKSRYGLPDLTHPFLFSLEQVMPRFLFNRLVTLYFLTDLKYVEYHYRERWIRELPKRQWWLLRLYPGQFRMFDLRKIATGSESRTFIGRYMTFWKTRLENSDRSPDVAPRAAGTDAPHAESLGKS